MYRFVHGWYSCRKKNIAAAEFKKLFGVSQKGSHERCLSFFLNRKLNETEDNGRKRKKRKKNERNGKKRKKRKKGKNGKKIGTRKKTAKTERNGKMERNDKKKQKKNQTEKKKTEKKTERNGTNERERKKTEENGKKKRKKTEKRKNDKKSEATPFRRPLLWNPANLAWPPLQNVAVKKDFSCANVWRNLSLTSGHFWAPPWQSWQSGIAEIAMSVH